MFEIMFGIILAPIALAAAAVTVALGVGIVKGLIHAVKKK